jgi:hypothetical protein
MRLRFLNENSGLFFHQSIEMMEKVDFKIKDIRRNYSFEIFSMSLYEFHLLKSGDPKLLARNFFNYSGNTK